MKIEELFRVDGQALEDEILSQPDPEQMVRIAELFLSRGFRGMTAMWSSSIGHFLL